VVQKRNHRVPASSTRARVAGLDVPVVNLSLGGACLAVADGLDGGPFLLELKHPHLPETAAVRAEVVWSTPTERAGVRFLDLDPEQRALVRRCMLAEYGHAVWAAAGATRPVGYVVPTKPGVWGIYDQHVTEVGQLRRDGGRLMVRTADVLSPAATVGEAVMKAFGLPRAPRLDPPLDPTKDPGAPPSSPPAPAAPTLTGSAVLDGPRTVGFVARTGTSWSFFDAGKSPLGFMTQADGEWRVVVFGSNDDGSLDLRRAPTYPDALAAAFSLAAPPTLRSATFQPTALLDA
jgi:hypothetical protein